MSPLTGRILAIAVLLGHFGLHLALYNRINSRGWPRRMIKLVEKILFIEMLLTPIAVMHFYPRLVLALFRGQSIGSLIPDVLGIYGLVCLTAWAVFGVPWLFWRPLLRWEWADTSRKIEIVDVQSQVGKPLARTPKCQWESKLPLNQIFDLAIEEISLRVVGLPEELDGYRVAHLSDIHLTGDVHPDYAKYAIERATQWSPDLIALTGDIIDKQPCIDWLVDIFSPASAPDGCYFILGNHDTRVVDSWQTREAMDRAGWTDLGSRALATKLRQVPTLMIGNEYPWFERADMSQTDSESFRFLISHSPDQIDWARKNNVTFMLAGHTHGGQGRLPIIGPLLSPSWHGTRYASGDFYRAPTTMHVTRGLGGVHLLRINCRPELSLLTLRCLDA